MSSIAWELREGSWEDTYALVGSELDRYEGADEVNKYDIRRRLEVLAWDCPLHYDEETAIKAGYRTIISPCTMVMSWALPAYWSPGQPRPKLGDRVLVAPFPFPRIPAPGDALFATDCSTRYVSP